MDIKTVCLGVLSRGNASGYEIKKYCEEGPFAHFYDAGFGSIYPALKKLGEEGLIEAVAADAQPDGRPDKKVYRITPKGEEALYDQLLDHPAPDKVRSEFLFTLFFAHLLPPRRIERLIQERIEGYRQLLARMGDGHCPCPLNADDVPGHNFVHGFGVAIYKAALDYLETHRQELVDAVQGRTSGADRAAE